VVRNARVQDSVTADGTLAKIRIEKGSFWNVADKIAFNKSNYGTIKAIVTTNADYDEVEFEAAIRTGCKFTKGDVLFPVKVTNGGSTTVTTAHQTFVYEAAVYSSNAIESLKIFKGSGIEVPANGKLDAKLAGNDIDITGFTAGGENDAYDTITITGIEYSVPLWAPISWSTSVETPNPDTFVAERTANFLAYAPAKVEAGASVTLLGRAFEIDEDKLYIPVTDADKASLGDRFMFI
jgi:hypothetical protein